ncbi:MAG TPA: glycosyltransferase family 4 protein [Gemmataceae bacterium]|nr:glycosyltransferase family 4 protein [Gemmataceae bacterium]
MKIASITAGAAGMFCGSCLHDNSLAAALHRLGHDALLVPTYTPIRTDEPDVSERRVFLGGLNVYLNYKSAFFQRLPRFLHRLLDRPALLRVLSRFTATPDYAALGALTLTMLRGEHGRQREEVERLATWLSRDIQPEIVTLSNVLLSGIAPALKYRLKVPVLAYLQGDDIFLDALTPEHRRDAIELIRANARHIDGYIATCGYYADFMAEFLSLPRSAIQVVLPGINLDGHGGPRAPRNEPPYTVGYFARIGPAKGLQVLAEAYVRLRQMPGTPPCRLRASGWLGAEHKPYLERVRKTLAVAGLADEFDYVESPDHAGKVRFLQSLDVFSVPTTYREPKGLYVLEALANGVPVVQPAHGSFPELVEATGGGLLTQPEDPGDLAEKLHRLLTDPALRLELGQKGREAVHEQFSAAAEARRTVNVYQGF